MTCRDVYRDVLELARGGREAAGAARARAHLDECESCRDRFAQQQALTAGLRALATAAQADDRPSEFDPRVIEAFAELAAVKSPTPLAPYDPASYVGSRRSAQQSPSAKADRTALRMRMVAGLAAVAVGASWWAFRGPEENMRPPTLPSRAIVPSQTQVVSPATPVGRHSALALPASQRGARHRTPRLLSPEGFVSLPAAAGLPDFESGEILRFEIAVASLPNYGVEIPPDAEDRPIEVDILVGQDGHARAIRLVHLKARMTDGETPARTLPVR